MSKAYTAWAKETIPQAEIVYDRFHLMKMMNERLDGVRRRVARKLDLSSSANGINPSRHADSGEMATDAHRWR